jgi:hypothetical protein
LRRTSAGHKKEGSFRVIQQIVLILTAGFFIYFGIKVLLGAFSLKDPFSFILTFFASNFIILISAALLIGFLFRMAAFYKRPQTRDEKQTSDKNE